MVRADSLDMANRAWGRSLERRGMTVEAGSYAKVVCRTNFPLRSCEQPVRMSPTKSVGWFRGSLALVNEPKE